MNIAELAIRNRTFTWTLSIAVLVLGWLAFERLPRLGNPEISLAEARVVTPYPGASAAEVEQEISEKIEMAAGQLNQPKRVESYSSRGLSVVSVLIQDGSDRHALPLIWTRLEREVDEVQPRLPPGAGPSIVEADVGKLFGSYYALFGEGYTPAELKGVAEMLQKELSRIDGIEKVILFGTQQETIYVEISRAKTDALGIGIEPILAALRSKNLPADAGRIRVGPEHVAIDPSELYHSEQDLSDLMIAAGRDRLIRLGEVAEIRRDYETPPPGLLRVDRLPAVGIGVATAADADSIVAGKAIKRRLAELTEKIPIGMELKAIYLQSDAAEEAIDAFINRLVLALALVVSALVLVLGLRVGLVIALVSLLTLAGTITVMACFQIALERVSLGALIMATGLIPANPILVVHGMRLRMDDGVAGIEAARETTARYAVPLLAGTAAIALAFAPIAGLNDSTGEYVHAIFPVIVTSLSVSWVASVTIAPVLADRFLKSAARTDERRSRCSARYGLFWRRFFAVAIRHRWSVLAGSALLFALSLIGFGFVTQIVFPYSARPLFLVEVYFREGTHIRETERWMDEIQASLHQYPGVARVVTAIGSNHPRFLPTLSSNPDPGSHYAVSLVAVDKPGRINEIRSRIQADLGERFPNALFEVRRLVEGPERVDGGIRLRISGPDPAELRRLADRVKSVIASDPDATAVRDDWGAKVKVARPILAADRARGLGIDRGRIATALRTNYSGTHTGYYREGGNLIPIVARAPEQERSKVDDMADIHVTSPLRADKISMQQLVDRLDTVTEDARRFRRDRLRTITVHADVEQDLTFELLERIKHRVEAALKPNLAAHPGHDPEPRFESRADTVPIVEADTIPLKGKPGYFIGWGGEAERSAELRTLLWFAIPPYFGLTLLMLILQFSDLRQPLIILLTVPLSMVGITAGLLLTGQPFGFMSLLGILVLSGILIRNAILLLHRSDLEIHPGEPRLETILRAVSSPLRPIGLAASASILAFLPLLRDELFASMAVTVIAGLVVGTLLSLVMVPVLYAILFAIQNEEAV